MNVAEWAGQYVGIPFDDHGRTREGADCWGLARLVLMEQYGLELPDYGEAYEDAKNIRAVRRAIRAGLAEEWKQVEAPQVGDLVIINLAALPWHCGLYVGDGRVLHVHAGAGAAIQELDKAPLKGKVEGFYRHERHC